MSMPLSVRSGGRKDYPYGLLHPSARLLIGLRQSTSVGTSEIARIFGVKVDELVHFEARILRNREGRFVMNNGLPAAFGEEVPYPVECRRCKHQITHVPCVSCCTMDGFNARNDREPELPQGEFGTDAMPGTQLKIAVMAARAARNQSIWHECDRTSREDSCVTPDYATVYRDDVLREIRNPSAFTQETEDADHS